MTATKNGETFSITEMARPDGWFQLFRFAPNGDLLWVYKDPTREMCLEALRRDGFVLSTDAPSS